MKGTPFSRPEPYNRSRKGDPEGNPQSGGPPYRSVHQPLTPNPAVPLAEGVPDHPLIGFSGELGPFETPDPLATQAGQIEGNQLVPETALPEALALDPMAGVAPSMGSTTFNAPGMMPLDLGALLHPPTSQDVATETQGVTPEAAELSVEQIQQREIEDEGKRKKAMEAIYGSDFPLILDHEPKDWDWQRWCDNRWTLHRPGVQHNIWMAERNRQFRAGYQYQSRINQTGAWRETPVPRDAVRIVDNRIRPALAWAKQVVAEQRPGWQFKPANTDADRERKADAQQRAVEYQYDAQRKRLIDAETIYWAQSDGVAFQMTGWDPEAGPWEELEQGRGPVPLGEPFTVVRRLEHVVVSSEATATIRPMYWIIRDILPMQYAVALYGPEVAENPDQQLLAMQTSQWSTTNQYAYSPLFQNQQTVARYTVFCDKREWLPEGMTAIVVGRKLVFGPKPLLMGQVPMVRITDGSEDPAFFPTPKMNLLIAPQMRVNQLWSKWYESIRKNSGGRYATKSQAVSAETFIGGETSLLEVRTSGDIREAFLPVQGFSVGNDIKEALDREIDTIEQLTGYTKAARGQFENDESGRAILAQRETLERVFAPQAAALAEGNTDWAKQMVGWMRFGYQMPRKLAITGNNRSDLATELTSADLDGIVDVQVDPSTMVPKPQALRQWELDNAYDRQIISKDEWRERSLFGNVKDIQTPRDVQYAKAKRVAQQILLGQPQEPIKWQDDEAINQNILEREIILAGGIDPQIQAVAEERWQQLAVQQQQKMMLTPPGMGGMPPQAGPPPKGEPMDPRVAPLAAGNPSAGGASAAAQGGPGVSEQERAVAQFESRNAA